MVSKVELGSLLDLAIGKPETGAVNFQVLHSFLQKLLGHLAVSNVEVEVGTIFSLFVLSLAIAK